MPFRTAWRFRRRVLAVAGVVVALWALTGDVAWAGVRAPTPSERRQIRQAYFRDFRYSEGWRISGIFVSTSLRPKTALVKAGNVNFGSDCAFYAVSPRGWRRHAPRDAKARRELLAAAHCP